MARLIRTSLCSILLAVIACGMCAAAPNQFVIVSDLHPSPKCEDQVLKVTEEVLKVRPAFVVQLGDVGNEEFPGSSVRQMKVIDAAFRKWREAGIEIHIVIGNHDAPRDKDWVEAIKRTWFASQLPPYPMNSQLDAEKNPDIYRRYVRENQYYYSFNWRGLHFVIMNSYDPDFTRQAEWLEEDLCKHANNSDKYPSLVFLHHPEWMSGDRNCESRPLYSILEKWPSEHTVRAVFGGHWHYGQYWPPEKSLGAHVYATPASVLGEGTRTELIVATAETGLLTFKKVTISPGTNRNDVVYYSIYSPSIGSDD